VLAWGAGLVPGARLLLGQDATFSTGVSVVNVLVSVRNKAGGIVHTLGQNDFKVEEDGRRQTIRYFSQQSDLGLTLGLMVDTSGSQRFVLGEERRASLQFLRSVMREDKDLGFVIRFDGEVELLQDVTASRRALENALHGPEFDAPRPQRRRPIGSQGPGSAGTALYDAVLLASEEMMAKQAGRKALILLTDGVDQGSKVSLSRAIEAAQRADTLIYSILFAGIGSYGGGRVRILIGGPTAFPGTPPLAAPPVRTNGGRVLRRISKETGGGYFEVDDNLPLSRIYERIQEELRNQYNLGYTSESQKSGYRKIKVSVVPKGLSVQAREGYYAE